MYVSACLAEKPEGTSYCFIFLSLINAGMRVQYPVT